MEKKVISLAQVSEIVDAVSDLAFVEVEGVIDYRPENVEPSKNFYKLLAYAPELKVNELDFNEFYEKLESGEYNEELDKAVTGQWYYINKAIDEKIAYRLSTITNPLNVALANLANTINLALEKNANATEGIDVKDAINTMKQFSKDFDMNKAVSSLIDKKNTQKNTKTNKTKAVE